PRLHVVKVQLKGAKNRRTILTFGFPEAQFYRCQPPTRTRRLKLLLIFQDLALKNGFITALKIKHNPFAKAFLDAKERPDQRDYADDSAYEQERGFSHFAASWYLPSTPHSLIPPPAHQFPPASRPGGLPVFLISTGYPCDVSSNLQVLNLASDNWSNMSMGGHSMLPASHASHGQYGVLMSAVGNMSPNQNCGMSTYLRSSTPYSLSTSAASSPGLGNMAPVRMILLHCFPV
ncbi:unnamed protein product, partial [Candidula unifasciata]